MEGGREGGREDRGDLSLVRGGTGKKGKGNGGGKGGGFGAYGDRLGKGNDDFFLFFFMVYDYQGRN